MEGFCALVMGRNTRRYSVGASEGDGVGGTADRGTGLEISKSFEIDK